MALILCDIPGYKTLEMKISAASKYPFIDISEPHIDFGDVWTGKQAERQFLLTNKSQVRATFNLRTLSASSDHLFTVKPTNGVIPPMESVGGRVRVFLVMCLFSSILPTMRLFHL